MAMLSAHGALSHAEWDRAAARAQLDEYILEYIDEADKSESLVRVGKGQGKQTTISFPDGSRWTVPPTFKAATAD